MRSQQVQAAESSDGRVVSILYKDGLFHDKPAMRERLWAKGPMKAFLPEGYPGSVTADYASTYISTQVTETIARARLLCTLTDQK